MDAADLYPEILRPFDPRNTPLPAPTQDICDPGGFCIYVEQHWWAHISGMIARLLYRDAWDGDDDEIDRAIQSISKILNVGDLSMGCGCGGSSLPFPTRIGENGQVQVSYDGGVTWVDAPQYDPRTNITQLPPVTGSDVNDARCKAANSAVAFLQEMQHDAYTKRQAGATLAAIAEAVIAFLVVVGIIATGGALAALGGALAAIAATASAADFDGAFTSGVWADLLCAIYCVFDSSGNIIDTKFAALIGQVKSDHAGIAGDFLSGAIQMLGKNGLTNATRLGLNAGLDCSGCDDCVYCYEWNFELGNGNWYTNLSWPGGGSAGATYGSGAWHSAHPGGSAGDDSTLYIVYDLPAEIYVTDLIITFSNSGMTNDAGDASGMTASASPFITHINGNKTQFVIYCYDPSGAGSMTISDIQITSPNPFPNTMTGGEDCT